MAVSRFFEAQAGPARGVRYSLGFFLARPARPGAAPTNTTVNQLHTVDVTSTSCEIDLICAAHGVPFLQPIYYKRTEILSTCTSLTNSQLHWERMTIVT